MRYRAWQWHRFVLLIFLACGACRKKPEPQEAPVSAAVLNVEMSGCASVRTAGAAPICELDAQRTVRFFVDMPPQASFFVRDQNGAQQPLTVVTLNSGVGIEWTIPKNTEMVCLRAVLDNQTLERCLFFAAKSTPAILDEADVLRKGGRTDEALKRLEPLDHDADEMVRTGALRLRARIMAMRGETDKALAMYDVAIREAQRLGRVSDELHDRGAAFYAALFDKRDFHRADVLLAGMQPQEKVFDEGRVIAAYYRALLARERGDLRLALSMLRQTRTQARKLRLPSWELDALEVEAAVLASLGRTTEAREQAERAHAALPSGASVCRRSQSATNLGWTYWTSRTGMSGADLQKATEYFAMAADLAREGCPSDLGNALTNQVLAALAAHEFDRATNLWNAAQAHVDPGEARVAVALEWAQVQLLLRKGKTREAWGKLDRLERLAAAALLPDTQFEAAWTRARLLVTENRPQDALLAFSAAEDLLDSLVMRVPLGEGRATYLPRYEALTDTHVSLLLEMAEKETGLRRKERWLEAAHVALHGKTRLLRSLACAMSTKDEGFVQALEAYRTKRQQIERDWSETWKASQDELPAVVERLSKQTQDARLALDAAFVRVCSLAASAKQLDLTTFPAEEQAFIVAAGNTGPVAWHVFERDIQMVSFDKTEALETAEGWRSLVGSQKSAKAIRLLVSMPYEGMALDATAERAWSKDAPPVVWGNGLSANAVQRSVDLRRAVVVGDPREDLPAARREALAVAESLQRRGARVTTLVGAQATFDATIRALAEAEVDILHYAGHAVVGGLDGESSGLPLAKGAFLQATDILSSDRVPTLVVLAACDSGQTIGSTRANGLGLAQAFLVRGSAMVVAASQPIRDEMSEQFVSILYQSKPHEPFDLVTAFQRARAQLDTSAMFRVFVP